MSASSQPDHVLSESEDSIHFEWNNDLEPVLTVQPGDTVRFECRVGGNEQITPDSTVDDVVELDPDHIHPLSGPVAIEGARPGDVLEVTIVEMEHHGWGWTAFRPGETGLGLLPEEFPDPYLHIWDLEEDVAPFVNGIEIPLDPFPGNFGVAPAEDGSHSTIPPRRVGGNMDVKHHTVGATVSFPVAVEDALFRACPRNIGRELT